MPLERARALVARWSLQPWSVLTRLGYARVLAGRPDEAQGLLAEVLERATTMSALGVGRAMQLVWLGEACLLDGRIDDASRYAHQALSLSRHHQERSHEAWSLRLRGQIALRGDSPDLSEAERCLRDALTIAGALGALPLTAHCHLHLGELCHKAARRKEASEHLWTATSLYRGMEMWSWLSQAEAASKGLA